MEQKKRVVVSVPPTISKKENAIVLIQISLFVTPTMFASIFLNQSH
jgi:hypothetical protein